MLLAKLLLFLSYLSVDRLLDSGHNVALQVGKQFQILLLRVARWRLEPLCNVA